MRASGAVSGYFLDVEASALGRPWRPRLDAAGELRALAIAQVGGQDELVARVLAGRGIAPETAERYLDPTLRELMPDPFVMRDMQAATERLKSAVERGERVAIFGDYDVDGACSAALLRGYLGACGCEAIVHIPDRVTEGYGPNVEAISGFAAAGAKLLVAVDCGAVSHEPFAHAARLGLDTIAFDHHQAPEALPWALAIVDPNRQDDLSGLGHLSAAGVVFMALVALNRALRDAGFWNGREAPDLRAALDLVALATVADVVPLTGLNRAFVVKGLQVMRQRRRPGLAALFDVAGADGPPSPYQLGFMIGPRINAGGRIGDAALGARLMTTADEIEARAIAAELDRLNRARREIETAALAEAEAEALLALGLEERGATVVVANPRWPQGIVGLLAARLKERFDRPAFVLTVVGGQATGSGRSIFGVDLGRTVRAAVEAGMLIKGGGHAMAAGVTLLTERLGDWRAFLEENAGRAGRPRPRFGQSGDRRGDDRRRGDARTRPPARSGRPLWLRQSRAGLRYAPPSAEGRDGRRRRPPESPRACRRRIVGRGDGLPRRRRQARRSADPAPGRKRPSRRDALLNRYGGRERVQLRVLDVAEAGR